MKKVILILAFLSLSVDIFAQLNLPEPSPLANFTQKVGFTDIKVVYSRPCAKNRKIFGALVPYNELWRTGAADATTIFFNEKVQLEGNSIEAGKYTLFSIPSEKEWTIVLNKDTAMHGTGDYNQANDVFRFKVNAEKAARFYETFTIEISDIVQNNAFLYLIWENTQVRIAIKTNADEKIMAEIQQKLAATPDDAALLFQASKYYFETQKDTKQALDYITKAVSLKDDNFYYFYQKALLEAKLGDFKTAILSANKSLELAKAKKMKEWVKKNEELIAEYSKK